MRIKIVSAVALAVGALSSGFAQTPTAQRAAGPEGAYQQAGKLPARILDFSAEPSAIQPGQTVKLRWIVENPASIDIDPGIGPVEATIEDPNVFAKPWTLKRSFPLRPELDKVDEFVCENNHDYTPLFKK